MAGTESSKDAPSGFLQLPRKTSGPSEVSSELEDAVLFGVPSDKGTVGRQGAVGGPRAVREASFCFAPYHPGLGLNVLEELSLIDGGDLILPTGVADENALLGLVQGAAFLLAQRNQIPCFVGGNQMLTLGALRGIVQAKRRPVALLHLSAHQSLDSGPFHEGSAIAWAQREGLLKSGHVLQLGLRGPYEDGAPPQEALRCGFEHLSVDDIRWDIHGAMATVRDYVDEAALYVSVDLSAFDPSVCPGVTRPSVGGLTSWEVQQLLRALVGAEIVGLDVVGLCPPCDHAALTSMVAVTVLFELLAVIADARNESRISLLGGGVGRTSA